MNVKRLKELLSDLPDDAIVYVESDHGQTPTIANYINFTADEDLGYDMEYANWSADEEDEEVVVTAILIS